MAEASTMSDRDLRYRQFCEGRLLGLRVNRYSWWTHWRELADYFLPRRYKWIITPNQMSRGSPINQHIIDSTGCISARNCAAGLLSGKTNPLKKWFKLRLGFTDSTGNNPISVWLAECERILRLIFQESNFYNAMATLFYDLVIFGTATIIIYEDYDNVINCYNPCLGEYYVDIDGSFRPCVLYREYTMTIGAVVDEFGYENCSATIRQLYDQPTGANLGREIIVAHAIEPNNDKRNVGIPKSFPFRECYWEWGGSGSPQSGAPIDKGFLRKRGFFEQPQATVRWDLVSNDPYGRSPGMDGLGDQKQLQLESRRKAQAIDKMVNPPLVADVQLKNQPASLLPGGITYVSNFASSGKPGFASVYDTKFPVGDITEDLNEVRERLRKIFFNDLFQTASQFETRSNITAVEWDMRKSEALLMLGPVMERIDTEGLSVILERVFGIAARAGILPPPPPEIQGQEIDVEFVSMLAQAQSAAEAAGIERLMSMVGNLAGVRPDALDKLNVDYAVDKYSTLLNNDPMLVNSQDQVMAIRQAREQQQQQAQQAAIAEQLATGAKTLSETDVGGGQNALQMMTGAG